MDRPSSYQPFPDEQDDSRRPDTDTTNSMAQPLSYQPGYMDSDVLLPEQAGLDRWSQMPTLNDVHSSLGQWTPMGYRSNQPSLFTENYNTPALLSQQIDYSQTNNEQVIYSGVSLDDNQMPMLNDVHSSLGQWTPMGYQSSQPNLFTENYNTPALLSQQIDYSQTNNEQVIYSGVSLDGNQPWPFTLLSFGNEQQPEQSGGAIPSVAGWGPYPIDCVPGSFGEGAAQTYASHSNLDQEDIDLRSEHSDNLQMNQKPLNWDRTKKYKSELVLVPCRACAISCTENYHEQLKEEWFEVLEFKNKNYMPASNDWDLLLNGTRGVKKYVRNKEKGSNVENFVVRVKVEYRKHLSQCKSPCEHSPQQMKLSLSKGPAERELKNSGKKSEPLEKLFPEIRKIVEATCWKPVTGRARLTGSVRNTTNPGGPG